MRIRTSVNIAVLLLATFSLRSGAGDPQPRTHARGDEAVRLERRTPPRYQIYYPDGYLPARPYPVVVGLFASEAEDLAFLEEWKRANGNRHPFLYVRPLPDASEVPAAMPAYSFSSPEGGGVPLTRVGWEHVEESLAGMLEVLAQRHRVTGAFVVTLEGMQALPMPVRVSDLLAAHRF